MFGRPFAIPEFARGGSVIALAVLLVGAIPAAGQLLTSRVDGRVLDQTGAVVPGVTVTLTNAATNVARETATNSSGLYVFPNVSQGNLQRRSHGGRLQDGPGRRGSGCAGRPPPMSTSWWRWAW